MAEKGVSFAGNGDAELTVNKPGTNPGSIGSKGGVVDFPGDVGQDATRVAETGSGKGGRAPEKGPVEFAGDI